VLTAYIFIISKLYVKQHEILITVETVLTGIVSTFVTTSI